MPQEREIAGGMCLQVDRMQGRSGGVPLTGSTDYPLSRMGRQVVSWQCGREVSGCSEEEGLVVI